MIHFSPLDESTRYSTYSLRNKAPSDVSPEATFYAFKVLPSEFAQDDGSHKADTCEVVTDRVVGAIQAQYRDILVEARDIVSLGEAQQNTGLLERVDYAVKRFLWL